MCASSNHVKFCTCGDAEPITPPMWTLERRDHSLSEQNMRGRVMTPTFSEPELSERDAILEALQTGGCFDFDYEPTTGDVLTVVCDVEGPTWRFRLESKIGVGQQWRVDTSNGFSRWRSQMIHLSSGPVDRK